MPIIKPQPREFRDPTRSMIHIDQPLTDIAVAYVPEQESFIAETIFPAIPVDKQSDRYYIWTKGFWMRNSVERRTPGDTYPRGRLQLSNTTYYCDLYHLAYDIPDEDRSNSDPGVELEQTGAEWLKTQFWLNREIKLAADIFVTSVWGTTYTGGTNFTQWDDYDDSNPISDVNTAKQTIQKSTGRRANTLVMGQEVFDILAEHPLLLEKFKYIGEGILDNEQVRKALKVDRLIVGESVYDSALEGGTASGGYIWGKNALVMYVAPNPGLRVPTAGYTFEWRIDGGGGTTVPIESIREDNRSSDVLQGRYAFDNKIVGTDLGYMLLSAVS